MLRNSRHLPSRVALITIAVLAAALVAGALHHSISRPALTAEPAVAQGVAPARVAPTTAAPPTAVESAPSAAAANRAPASKSPALFAPGAAGMVVGIDPETGKLGAPSKADRAALERAANMSPALDRSDAGLSVVHRPDGSMMVDLQGRFQDYAVMHIGPDGKKSETCVQESEVGAALRADSPPAATAPAPDAQPETPHAER